MLLDGKDTKIHAYYDLETPPCSPLSPVCLPHSHTFCLALPHVLSCTVSCGLTWRAVLLGNSASVKDAPGETTFQIQASTGVSGPAQYQWRTTHVRAARSHTHASAPAGPACSCKSARFALWPHCSQVQVVTVFNGGQHSTPAHHGDVHARAAGGKAGCASHGVHDRDADSASERLAPSAAPLQTEGACTVSQQGGRATRVVSS